MALADDIKELLLKNGGELKKKNVTKYSVVVAERKAFLSTKKLEYKASFRVDETSKKVLFSEMLGEKGAGISSGGDFDGTPGFGFKTETYKTGGGAREGSVKEQSDLFGKKYDYNFDFNNIRPGVKKLAEKAGYAFEFSLKL